MKKIFLFLSCMFCFSIILPKQQTRIYVSMVADLFHYGHVAFLKQAKQFGNYLIVGLISDEDATPYKRRPILTLQERAKTLHGCKYVDEIILNAPLVCTREWINHHNIDIVVHGNDFNEEKMMQFFKDPVQMGIMRIISYTPGISTSMIIDRITQRFVNQ